MSAVLALLIGVTAGDGIRFPGGQADSPILSPVNGLTPAERARRRIDDDETVGGAPSGMVTIERRIIIRIPMLPSSPVMVAPLDRGEPVAPPRRATCLSLHAIRGANVQERGGLMFMTAGNGRYRAILERGCRPVDFQSGFYLNATEDGALCAGRDMIHARSGLRCTITQLKRVASGE